MVLTELSCSIRVGGFNANHANNKVLLLHVNAASLAGKSAPPVDRRDK